MVLISFHSSVSITDTELLWRLPRLIRADEEHTIAALKTLRADLIDPKLGATQLRPGSDAHSSFYAAYRRLSISVSENYSPKPLIIWC